MIKGLLFDYGGTIDTNGLHWGAVLWNSYQKFDLGPSQALLNKELFSKAYAFGERALAIQRLVKTGHDFHDVLSIKVREQFRFLKEQGVSLHMGGVAQITADCYKLAHDTVSQNQTVLEELAARYPLVMVSNFYGNLRTVLADFGILPFFKDVVESAVVGVRKPDPAIYGLGVEALGLPAENCLAIGDSYRKDIVPAKENGCLAAWIHVQGWEDEVEQPAEREHLADFLISDLHELPGLI